MEVNQKAILTQKLRKQFNDFLVIDDFSLEVEEGSIVSILAPSAAGKTTLLRILAGIILPTSGTVKICGQSIHGVNPNIGYIFQEDSVFPWLTVRQNIAFGLSLRAHRHENSIDLVRELAQQLYIDRVLDSYPSQLSGGQRQRVVIARSLILQPKVLLCDEPFSALDELTRAELRELLLRVHARYHPAVIFITHSVEEAIFLGSRVVICSGPPLRFVDAVDIPFSLPRRSDLVDTEAFRQLHKKVKRMLLQ